MLRELHIKNVAVIEEATVEFDNGFQVLTGETGAGKSILIDSINMALGGRGNRELIRTGADYASADLAFEIVDEETLEKMSEFDIECDDCTVLISRKIYTDGKSKCYVNGRLTPLNIVRELGAILLTIHGQNDNQSILMPSRHIGFVDEFGDTAEILSEYKEQFKKLTEIKNELSELNIDTAEQNKLIELLTFQVREIDSAKLKPNEEELLEDRRSFLQNAELISESAEGAYYALYGGESAEIGAYDSVSYAVQKLDKVREYDSSLAKHYDTLSSVIADIDDVMHELRNYIDGTDYSQSELDDVESRLSLIYSLKRKYGNTISEILEYGEESRKKLNLIEKSDEKRDKLETELNKVTIILSEIAERLTQKRMDTALKLQECIMNELADLDMQKMRFSVSVSPVLDDYGNTKFTPNGCDNVEFLISANPGEALKPIMKIASGGEMSRIMLAIKSVLFDADGVGTLIFDEIDTGVSGRAAQKIAEKMGMLSKKCQLICITHLAQIAAMADYQYLIEKNSDTESTKTTVRLVDGEERKAELARILGGVRVTDITLEAAQEMLELAKAYKKSV